MKKKILVVDDERLVRWAMEQTLNREGYKVITAESGEIVAEIIKEDRDFDLVISDIKLPGIDGWEVFELVRKAMPESRMIAITAEDISVSSDALTDKGISCFIKKPFYMEQITETVGNILNKKK